MPCWSRLTKLVEGVVARQPIECGNTRQMQGSARWGEHPVKAMSSRAAFHLDDEKAEMARWTEGRRRVLSSRSGLVEGTQRGAQGRPNPRKSSMRRSTTEVERGGIAIRLREPFQMVERRPIWPAIAYLRVAASLSTFRER